MNFNKKVTVLMPVYNAELYLKEAISSILNQTYRDFTFLIIDDGSLDDSYNIVKSFNDHRIILLKNEKNLGIVKTLNLGFDLIDSEYIVRMDSDDISYPDRLRKQIKFMDAHKHIPVSGTSINLIDQHGKYIRTRKVEISSKSIRSKLLIENELMHPTLILRKSVFNENQFRYKSGYNGIEDYELWTRMSQNYDFMNIKEVLLKYRLNEKGITGNFLINDKIEKNKLILQQHFDFLKIKYDDEMIYDYINFIYRNYSDINFDNLLKVLIEIEIKINSDIYEKKYFSNQIERRLAQYIMKSKRRKYLLIIAKNNLNDNFRIRLVYKLFYLLNFKFISFFKVKRNYSDLNGQNDEI